ncbi:hypothetical protein BOTBODRAFT_478170 [Botryobasidium botryosum FD-172 SS1]|uniref:Uncharacterized protein n=1 Tax=Botryobasidium botryosum (strain FD-172 SS1) TaxID=930990 RepID=A0A067MW31_BOTB1|nr:hypothetical protein BOTBODRAFT_478170 [Botryobasidium botryosum FD-172 SS1]
MSPESFVLPPPSAHTQSKYTTFASWQPPQSGDCLKLRLPDSTGILFRTPSRSKATSSSSKSRSKPKLQWVIVVSSMPIAREDGTIEAYKLNVYPMLSFGGPSGYDELSLLNKLKCLPIPPADPLRSSDFSYAPQLCIDGFVNSRLSWLHTDVQGFTYSVKDKIRHYTPHVRLPLDEMNGIAAFIHRLTPLLQEVTSYVVGPTGEGGGTGPGVGHTIEAYGGGNVFPVPTFTIHGWGGGAERADDMATPSCFDGNSVSPDFSRSTFDSDTDSSDTKSDEYDDPNSEEFMRIFSPERYTKFLQQRAAQELMAERIRMNSISAWRAEVQRLAADDSA